MVDQVGKHCLSSAGFPCDDGMAGAAEGADDFFCFFINLLHRTHVYNVVIVKFRFIEADLHFKVFDFTVQLVDFLNILKNGICSEKFPMVENRVGIDNVFFGWNKMYFFIQYRLAVL